MKLRMLNETHGDSYPQMRLAARNIRNKIILESKVPQSGAYWWIPKPDGTWELDPYYDSDFRGNTMHDKMWKYVVEKLAIYWNKEPQKLLRRLRDNYAGLPRGRIGKIGVSRYGLGGWVVSHGDDAPIPDGLNKVLSAFNLIAINKAGKVKIAPDDHEQMMEGDPEAVQQAIGKDLGLKGASIEFDDEDW